MNHSQKKRLKTTKKDILFRGGLLGAGTIATLATGGAALVPSLLIGGVALVARAKYKKWKDKETAKKDVLDFVKSEPNMKDLENRYKLASLVYYYAYFYGEDKDIVKALGELQQKNEFTNDQPFVQGLGRVVQVGEEGDYLDFNVVLNPTAPYFLVDTWGKLKNMEKMHDMKLRKLDVTPAVSCCSTCGLPPRRLEDQKTLQKFAASTKQLRPETPP